MEGKNKIAIKYEKKEQDLDVQKRMYFFNYFKILLYRKSSQVLSEQNTRFLKHREELLDKLLDNTKIKLAKYADCKSDNYKKLIQQLLIQSFIKMKENNLQVKCRECDLDIVKEYLFNLK